MSVAEVAVSSVEGNLVTFLLDGSVHQADMSRWRGAGTPKMGDIVEVALDESRQVVRFFPRDTQPASAAQDISPVAKIEQEQNLALRGPAYCEKEVEILGRRFDLLLRNGFVLAADTTTQQSISTSYRRAGNGWVPDVQSHQYTTSNIRLLQQGGKKADFTLGQKYTIHGGDEVTLVSISRKGAESGWWLGIHNHTTDKWEGHGIDKISGDATRDLRFYSPAKYLLIPVMYVVAGAFLGSNLGQPRDHFWLALWLGMFAGVVGFFHMIGALSSAEKKLKAKLQEEVQRVLRGLS